MFKSRIHSLFTGKGSDEIFILNIFFQLNVYFSTLNVETISEVEDFPLMNLLSDIGGDLSLYIGITTLTFFEFGEWFIRIVYAIMSSKNR